MGGRKPVVRFDEKAIGRLFAALDQDRLPGVAVGVALDGKPVWRAGFGRAHMELPVALSPTIRMRIGSVSKHFTALAYMLLCEEGLATVDDPVGKHLPELHSIARRVTARQLMAHINGLRDVCAIKLDFSGLDTGRVTSGDLMSLYRTIDDVTAAPGTIWIYNNGGYFILSEMIERISGQPLEEVLRRRIFEPAGMTDTLLRRWDTDFVPNSATAHMTRRGGGWMLANYGMDNFSGGGAIVSTVDDMLRWLAHMEAPTVGRAATWTAMKTPHVLPNGTSTDYGLGLCVPRYRGIDLVYHSGGGVGCNAAMLKAPAAGLDIAIMANRDDVSAMQLAFDVLGTCLPELGAGQPRRAHPPAIGTFRSPVTGRVIQLMAQDGRQIVSIDGNDLLFERNEDGVLRPAATVRHFGGALTLLGDPERPESLRLDDFGHLDDLVSMRPGDADAGSIAGRYRSEATGTEALVTATDAGARLSTVGRFGAAEFTMECLGPGVWRSTTSGPRQRYGSILTFDADGFRFSNWSLRGLPFRRCA